MTFYLQKRLVTALSISALLFCCSGTNAEVTEQIVTQDTSTTNSTDGFQIIDTKVGDGATATAGYEATVHYTGWLYEPAAIDQHGIKFDSSVDRDQPFTFKLGIGYVIKGWDQGIEGMKVGGKRTLIIPPEMGYGSTGDGRLIPPNATTIFDVELMDVEINRAETCSAVADSDETSQNTILTTASVLTNDTDTDGDILVVLSADPESVNGVTVINNGDGTFTYTPAIDFSGMDTFNYIVTDNNGCTSEATFSVTIIADVVIEEDEFIEEEIQEEIEAGIADEVTDSPEESTSSGGGSLNVAGAFTLFTFFLTRRLRKKITK